MSFNVITGDVPSARASFAFSSIGGFIFVFGGRSSPAGFNTPVGLNDLYMFDPLSFKWTRLDQNMLGIAPIGRYDPGFSAAGSWFCFFGGAVNRNQAFLDDLTCVDVPEAIPLPQFTNPGFLIDVYDWDQLFLQSTSESQLLSRLLLCAGPLPCALSLRGVGSQGGILRVAGHGSFACLAAYGCSLLSLSSIQLDCARGELSSIFSAIEVAGALLVISDIMVNGSWSGTDGGSVRVYAGATVQIDSSTFLNSRSEGRGGAVSAVGATLSITSTRFINCSAHEGGGAIAATSFNCYGSVKFINTLVLITESEFHHCSSGGSGGAVFVESGYATLNVSASTFTDCLSNEMGGAFAVVDGATVLTATSIFLDNTAAGLGGGALYARNSQLTLHGVSAHGNSAAAGGGGVLYWQGQHPPVYLSWCKEGFYPDPKFECTPKSCAGSCLPCRAGTYHTSIGVGSVASCIPCKAGTFAPMPGATSCTSCEPSRFSNKSSSGFSNSSACVRCPDGAFSELNETMCRECQSNRTGNVSMGIVEDHNCTLCAAGTVFIGVGATSAADCSVFEVFNSSTRRDSAGSLRAQTAHTFYSTVDQGIQIDSNMETLGSDLNRWSRPIEEDKKHNHRVFYLERNMSARMTLGKSERIKYSALRRMDEEVILCGNGNQALFGPCIASAGSSLELQIEVAGFIFPDLSFPLSVRKLDHYNQTVASDSASILQIRLEVGPGLDSSGKSKGPGLAAVISGTTIFELQAGFATINVAVRPNIFVSPSTPGLIQLASETMIYVEGTDTETSLSLRSGSKPVSIDNGHHICPKGYILTLDKSTSLHTGSASLAGCILCSPGTYSINPLYGSSGPKTNLSLLLPKCLTCPTAGTCLGGDKVSFEEREGNWVVSDGFYLLVGCPRGHALVLSLEGGGIGDFSQDAQRCVQCSISEYILDTNNSRVSCQPCPVGAKCDGSTLQPKVPGSFWEARNVTGQYILVSCPPGYELINTAAGVFSITAQECNLCPPRFYCSGVAIGKMPCPGGSFSPAGSSAASACAAAVLVEAVFALPLSAQAFDPSLQLGFRNALAFTCQMQVDHVVITSISASISRRSLNMSIQVAAVLAAKEVKAAAFARSMLQQEMILNENLRGQGLPEGRVLSVSIQMATSADNSQWLGVWVSLASAVLIVLLIIALYFCAFHHRESEEERQLRNAINSLRVRLGITSAQGFPLSSEHGFILKWIWRRQEQHAIVQRSYIEAAARLSLFLEFDITKFDAFCLCLQCSGSNDYSLFGKFDDSPPAYEALCSWMLEICQQLIRPNIPAPKKKGVETQRLTEVQSGPETGCSLSEDLRFPYFLKRISKCRIWSDSGGALFKKLKTMSKEYMDDISQLCNERVENLASEEGGEALFAFHASPNEAAGIHQILRQDNPEVSAITVSEASRHEASMEEDLGRPSGLGEEVFLVQLLRRATLLNVDFQARVFDVIASHAVSKEDTTCPPPLIRSRDWPEPTLQPARLVFDDNTGCERSTLLKGKADSDRILRLQSLPSFRSAMPGIYAAQTVVTATIVRSGSGPCDLPSLGRGANILPSQREPPSRLESTLEQSETSSSSENRTRSSRIAPSLSNLSSCGALSVPEVWCRFLSRDGPVWVIPAGEKGIGRMREKVAEYRAEGAPWPRAASILDPVRATVVCEGPSEILEVAGWFLSDSCGGNHAGNGRGQFPVCRIKNKFACNSQDLLGGYRDLMLCCVLQVRACSALVLCCMFVLGSVLVGDS